MFGSRLPSFGWIGVHCLDAMRRLAFRDALSSLGERPEIDTPDLRPLPPSATCSKANSHARTIGVRVYAMWMSLASDTLRAEAARIRQLKTLPVDTPAFRAIEDYALDLEHRAAVLDGTARLIGRLGNTQLM